MMISRLLVVVIVAGIAAAAWAQYDSWCEHRDTEKLRQEFRTQIAARLARSDAGTLNIEDARNLIAHCGPSPAIRDVYASARKHRFDFAVDCGPNFPVYVVVKSSDDGFHRGVAGSPPAEAK